MNLNDFIKVKGLGNCDEIVFYGGTFNPWHLGHSACIKKARSYTKSPIIIIPDNNPFKEVINQKDKESLLENIPKFSSKTLIYKGFYELETTNPTHNWIEGLKQEFPNLNIVLLIGFDNFMSIDRWFQADKLLKYLTGLLVVSRNDNNELKDKQIINLKAYNSSLEIDFLGNHKHEQLSSTDIRNG